MARLDPRLQFLRRNGPAALASPPAREGFGLDARSFAVDGAAADPLVRILLRFADLDAARAAGFRDTTVAGDVAAGHIPFSRLSALEATAGVVVAECSRPLRAELDVSLRDARVDVVHRADPPSRGAGAIVGIVDTGIDFRHPCFRNPDGTTRILAIWDQGLEPRGDERAPAPYGYGVAYPRAAIDAALASAAAPAADAVRHADYSPRFHGTHVAGIVAGNGRVDVAEAPFPSGRFVGVAPEADIVVVANRTWRVADSANALDAVDFVRRVADAHPRADGRATPFVVNLSHGDNVGPHDGTSLLERGLDALLDRPGCAMVKSAGNAAGRRVHASGRVGAGESVDVLFASGKGNQRPDVIEIWYAGDDELDVTLRVPASHAALGAVEPWVARAGAPMRRHRLANGNAACVESIVRDPLNGANRIHVILERGAADQIARGPWAVRLTGGRVVDGRFHAWVDAWWESDAPDAVADDPRVRLESHLSDDCTVTTPGCARRVITVGAYVSKPDATRGPLSASSSRGPTRDGRAKPDLCAPGEIIWSAGPARTPATLFQENAGTSMSAPHVTGVVALMLARHPTLGHDAILDCLTRSARRDAHTGDAHTGDAASLSAWGAGKLDAAACLAAVPPAP